MEPERDEWFWAAVVVTVAAIFCWALATTLNVGGAWVPWVAVIVSVLALGGVSTRAALRARGVVWTEEEIDALRRRYRRLFLEMIWWSPITLGLWVSMGLVKAEILPQWAGAVLLLLSWAAALVIRFAIRGSRAWKDLN